MCEYDKNLQKNLCIPADISFIMILDCSFILEVLIKPTSSFAGEEKIIEYSV